MPPNVRSDRQLALGAFLEKKRNDILSSPYSGPTARDRAAGKRHVRKLRTRILQSEFRHSGKRQVIRAPNLLLYKLKDDHLRDTLSPKFSSRYTPIKKRIREQKKREVTLSNFSFARNPKGTLKQIREVARSAATHIDVRINFTDSKCDDIAPYMVLAKVVGTLPPVFSGGLINREVATVLESVGLDRLLGVKRYVRDNGPFPILPFKMAFRAPPGFFGDKDHLLRPQYKEFIADKFCSAMEKWLEAKGFELTESGAEGLIVSITEALDNAERHGCPEVDDGLGDWLMAGFARIVFDGAEIQRIECSVSIVSIGSTISSSLTTASSQVSGIVDGYSELQSKKHGIPQELGRTIAALQDGITRDDTASSAKRGGIGLLTLAEIFSDLGETDNPDIQSVFTIISGNSCLRLSYPYRKGVAPPHSSLRKLWFNTANDGNMAPDTNHAFTLKDLFPGTILSACFCIDPAYLQKKLSA